MSRSKVDQLITDLEGLVQNFSDFISKWESDEDLSKPESELDISDEQKEKIEKLCEKFESLISSSDGMIGK